MLLSLRTLQTQSCDLSPWAGRYSEHVEKYRPEAHSVLPDFLQPVGRCPAHCAALNLANSLRTRNAAYERAYRAQDYSWQLSQDAAADLRNDAVHVLSVGRDVRFVAALREIVGLLRGLEAVGRRRGRHEVQVTAFAAALQKIGVRLDYFQEQLLGLAVDAAKSRARKPDAAAPAPAPAPHLEGGPTPTTTAVVARPEQQRPAATRKMEKGGKIPRKRQAGQPPAPRRRPPSRPAPPPAPSPAPPRPKKKRDRPGQGARKKMKKFEAERGGGQQ
jgi:hypothetical protein